MNLKRMRIVVSLIVFGLFTVSFLGADQVSQSISSSLAAFQLVPALIRFVLNPAVLTGTIVFGLILLALVFGRVYCSFLCPLGVFQDLTGYISRKIGFQKRYYHLKSKSGLHISVMIVVAAMAGMGSFTLLKILDPYSIFGRFTVNQLNLVVVWLHNLVVGLFESFDWYVVRIRRSHLAAGDLIAFSMISMVIVTGFAMLRGRLYCQTICPAGALLRIVSGFSLFRFTIDADQCKSCGRCEEVCKAGCIDIRSMSIDSGSCVVCFNCLEICNRSAVEFRLASGFFDSGEPTSTKRRLFLSSMALFGAIASLFPPVRFSFDPVRENSQIPVLPPGSQSVIRFLDACMACHMCVSACKTNVLTPALQEHGTLGLLQPVMDFSVGHCDYECNICSQVCPTGAIEPISPEVKKTVQIGIAELNKEDCVVYDKKNECGACGEACPTMAITATGAELHFAPLIDPDFCIGCGACEAACPTQPKAISVTANLVHSRAKAVVFNKDPVDQSKSELREFPF